MSHPRSRSILLVSTLLASSLATEVCLADLGPPERLPCAGLSDGAPCILPAAVRVVASIIV